MFECADDGDVGADAEARGTAGMLLVKSPTRSQSPSPGSTETVRMASISVPSSASFSIMDEIDPRVFADIECSVDFESGRTKESKRRWCGRCGQGAGASSTGCDPIVY